MKYFLTLILTGCALFGTPLQAGAAETLFQLQARSGADRLTVNWPRISNTRLAQVIDDTRGVLADQQQAAVQAIDKYRQGSHNYLLAAIMPGGLLYLAYQKNQLQASEQNLQLVNAEINELADDRLQLGLPIFQVAEATLR